ncbi:MAG: heme exporter protein CcmD [Rhodospirillales bacterium]
MDQIADFAAMGGYAMYVWPAYALCAAVLGGILIASVRSLRARAAEVAALEAVLPRRRRPAGDAAGGGDDA